MLPSVVPPALGPALDRLPARPAFIGTMELARLLPRRARRTIGPWCFIDHVGPANVRFEVGEHPHIGLQTVTWLIEGEVLHRDSLGNRQTVRPGQLNWMTAGRGIAHAERGLTTNTHAVQLWVALPAGARTCEPSFDHHPVLPRHDGPGWTATVLGGDVLGHSAPTTIYSPLMAVELDFQHDAAAPIPLRSDFEHGMFVAQGRATVDEIDLPRDVLLYAGTDRSEITIHGKAGTKLLVIGGEPFNEPLVMWWNFVARHPDEVRAARADWENGRFPAIPDYEGEHIQAPPLRDM